eukprot:TRINITY_DN3140_c0_g1_i1.p1 TRINITY_DN3140_c0_g1~~TRINITY_DN3140_c0_g1_i1.p1  ORF type:complete len:220 (-),score=28.15 TRINITY_DN3140_c0_g1_i1:234-893(-)
MATKGRKRKLDTTNKDDLKPKANKKTKNGPAPKKESSGTGKGASTVANDGYWLIKSEPESRIEKGIDMKFSFDDLKAEKDSTACWDGVRNYQARNFMRNMKVGQKSFFYHSNTKPPGIVGLVEIVREAYPDHTQFDSKDPHYDPSSKKEDPRWDMVDVKYIRPTERYIPLDELKRLHLEHKGNGGPLANLALFTKARLSVMPISQEEWNFILQLEKELN